LFASRPGVEYLHRFAKVLRCGKTSITRTKAGKVVIEGTYLSNKSTRANRIKGGSIQLN
jgi:hypothetical protein